MIPKFPVNGLFLTSRDLQNNFAHKLRHSFGEKIGPKTHKNYQNLSDFLAVGSRLKIFSRLAVSLTASQLID